MPNVLRERWSRDRDGSRSASGNIDMPGLLAAWFADPAWREEAFRLPPAERREILADIGREAVVADTGRFGGELRWNLALLDWLWSGDAREDLALAHGAYLFSSLSDSLDFHGGTRPDSACETHGIAHIEDALARGRGVILFAAYQSHPGYALQGSALCARRIGIVRKAEAAGGPSLMLAGVGDHVWEIGATRTAARAMLAALACNEIIAVYSDYVYPGAPTADGILFGRAFPIARALLAVAWRSGAALLPMAVARDGPGRTSSIAVRFFADVRPGDDLDRETWIAAAALKVGVAMECMIRLHPAQWRLWNTLRHRCR